MDLHKFWQMNLEEFVERSLRYKNGNWEKLEGEIYRI
jgi:hypothetical protein